MDKDNKYHSLIEKLVREHKKFPGYEAIIEDIIDDVFSHSEVVINSIDNESVIQSFLEKVISTSIITVPKKLNFNLGTRHRVITNSIEKAAADNIVNKPEKTDVSEESLPTVEFSEAETIEPALSDDLSFEVLEEDIDSTQIADALQEKANTELVDRMINSIDSDSIKADLYREDNDGTEDVIELLQDDTEVDIEEGVNGQFELSDGEELITDDNEGYTLVETSDDNVEITEDNEDTNLLIDNADETNDENSGLSFSDTLKQTQTDNEEEQFEPDEGIETDNSLQEEDVAVEDDKYIKEEDEIVEFSDDIDSPEFEPISEDYELSEEHEDTLLESEEDVDGADITFEEENNEPDELDSSSDAVDTSLGLFETTYKYDEDDSELSETSEELNDIELNTDELVDDNTLKEEADVESGFFPDDSEAGEELSVDSDEQELIEENEPAELEEEPELSLEYNDISLNEENIEDLTLIGNAEEELTEELSEDAGVDLAEQNDGIALLNSDISENEFEEIGDENASESDIPQEYFDNIQLVEDYNPYQVNKSVQLSHKTIDFSVFNFEPKTISETFDTEALSDKIIELNNNKPELNILNIFEMRYKQKLTVERIASDLGLNKKDVIDVLSTITELV